MVSAAAASLAPRDLKRFMLLTDDEGDGRDGATAVSWTELPLIGEASDMSVVFLTTSSNIEPRETRTRISCTNFLRKLLLALQYSTKFNAFPVHTNELLNSAKA